MAEEQGKVEQDLMGRLIGDVQLTGENDRQTVRINFYHESLNEPTVGEDIVACKALSSKGIEPYIRKFKATSKPKELSLGDIDRGDVGYILITNLEGTRLQQNPTDEERAELNSHIAVINGFEIHPFGMPFLGQPKTDEPLLVRCLHGEAVLKVCIFPR